MNIQLDKQANGTGYVTVTVEPADYEEIVTKELKKLRRDATLPGFRPGMVPQALINKKYRKSVLAEAINKLSVDKLEQYLRDEEIDTIGEILPSEKQTTIDLDNDTTFDFMYKFGISPKVEVALNKRIKVQKPILVPDDDTMKKYTDNFIARFAELKDFDDVQAGDIVSANLDNGQMQIEDVNIRLKDIPEDMCKEFEGKKTGDKLDVDIVKLFPKEKQRAAVLSLKEEELATVKSEFSVLINKSQRFVNPELNEEFFEKAFPNKDVTTKEEMDEKLRAEFSEEINAQTKWGFWNDVIDCVRKHVKIDLPEEFLKEWLFVINENKFTKEEIEAEYPKFADMMKWELIRKEILTSNNVKMDKDLLMEEARNVAREMYASYGLKDVPEEYLNSYAEQMLKDKEKTNELFTSAADRKAIEIILGMIGVVEKNMTMEEYSNAIKEKNKKEK